MIPEQQQTGIPPNLLHGVFKTAPETSNSGTLYCCSDYAKRILEGLFAGLEFMIEARSARSWIDGQSAAAYWR